MSDPDLPAGSLPIGTITIQYYLGDDGQPYVDVTRPGFNQIPALCQIGMVVFAQNDIMNGNG